MCVWGRDQGINTCVCGGGPIRECGGGTKELIHVCAEEGAIHTCGGGAKELIHVCVGEGPKN